MPDPEIDHVLFDPNLAVRSELEMVRVARLRDLELPIPEGRFYRAEMNVRGRLHRSFPLPEESKP
jgi:hypothetical protein